MVYVSADGDGDGNHHFHRYQDDDDDDDLVCGFAVTSDAKRRQQTDALTTPITPTPVHPIRPHTHKGYKSILTWMKTVLTQMPVRPLTGNPRALLRASSNDRTWSRWNDVWVFFLGLQREADRNEYTHTHAHTHAHTRHARVSKRRQAPPPIRPLRERSGCCKGKEEKKRDGETGGAREQEDDGRSRAAGAMLGGCVCASSYGVALQRERERDL